MNNKTLISGYLILWFLTALVTSITKGYERGLIIAEIGIVATIVLVLTDDGSNHNLQ